MEPLCIAYRLVKGNRLIEGHNHDQMFVPCGKKLHPHDTRFCEEHRKAYHELMMGILAAGPNPKKSCR